MTITLGDISVRYLNLLLEAAEQTGIVSEPVRHQYLLDSVRFSHPEARISIPKFMRVGHDLMASANQWELGLTTANLAQPSLMGWAGITACCAPTLERALIDMAEFEPLNAQNARGRSSYYKEGNKSIAAFYSISPYNQYNHFIVDMALAVQYSVLNSIAGKVIQPTRIEIEFDEPDYSSQYSSLFHCPVYFNQKRNAIVYKQSELKNAPKQSNELTYRECRQLCEEKLKTKQRKLSFVEKVRNEITPLLHSKKLTMTQVANSLEMPEWTLRRRLKQENTSFNLLLDETRKAMALIYLKDDQYSLQEITYLLGFANPNAFQRAFKRWEGVAPGAYREGV